MMYKIGCFESIRQLCRWIFNSIIIAFIVSLLASFAYSEWTSTSIINLPAIIWRSIWPLPFSIIMSVTVIFILVWAGTSVIVHLAEQGDDYELYSTGLRGYRDTVYNKYRFVTPWADIAVNTTSQRKRPHHLAAVSIPMQNIRILVQASGGRSAFEFSDDEREQRQRFHNAREIFHGLPRDQRVAIIFGGSGTGKTTTLSWLAFHMAQAYRLWFPPLRWLYMYRIGILRRRTPILFSARDYANQFAIARTGSDRITVEYFITEYYLRSYSSTPHGQKRLARKLEIELDRGRCLVLIDGLNEIPDDERRLILPQIQSFLDRNAAKRGMNQNIFILASRIDGYIDTQTKFEQYHTCTLQSLTDTDIQNFARNWCHAFYRYRLRQGMLKTKREAMGEAHNRHRELLGIINKDSRIRELVRNPLMLTMLIWLHCSCPAGVRENRLPPTGRLELLEAVTDALIAPKQDGEITIQPDTRESIALAQRALSQLAYTSHSDGSLCSEGNIKDTTRHLVSGIDEESRREQLTDRSYTLILNSGLLIERPGPDTTIRYYRFMHPVIEEYFAARHLSSFEQEELQRFFVDHYLDNTWYDPLVLTLVHFDTQTDDDELAGHLILAVANTDDGYNNLLQRNLITAARLLVDSEYISKSESVEREIAFRFFNLYGDFLGKGRFRYLQQHIEDLSLRWLKALPKKDDWHLHPLLQTWHNCLCNGAYVRTQEGAVRLLAAIVHELPALHHRKQVESALIPPLLQIVRMHDQQMYTRSWLGADQFRHIQEHMPTVRARPGTPRIEAYAYLALRLLGKSGPQGWLIKEWQETPEPPEGLAQLSLYSQEINYLLSPAVLPEQREHTAALQKLTADWRHYRGRGMGNNTIREITNLQRELLAKSGMVRYPLAQLYRRLLKEIPPSTPGQGANRDWRYSWNNTLQREMANGYFASYQQSLWLRLLIYRDEKQRRKEIALELRQAFVANGMNQAFDPFLAQQALQTIISMFLLQPDKKDLEKLQPIHSLLAIHYIRNWFDWLNVADLTNDREIDLYQLLQIIDSKRSLRTLRELQEAFLIRIFQEKQPGNSLHTWHQSIDLRKELKTGEIVHHLCAMLKEATSGITSTVLLTLFCIVATGELSNKDHQKVRRTIEEFRKKQKDNLTQEQELLADGIITICPAEIAYERALQVVVEELLGFIPESFQSAAASGTNHGQLSPDDLAKGALACKEKSLLTADDITNLLQAFVCTRELSPRARDEMNAMRPQEIALPLLSLPYEIDSDGQTKLLSILNVVLSADFTPMETAGAALLLRYCKKLDFAQHQLAVQRIVNILPRPLFFNQLDVRSDNQRFWQLDDVLYETLVALVGGSTTTSKR